ncbi:hypothetical protein ACRRTK_018885 [Alexandromys fortis]
MHLKSGEGKEEEEQEEEEEEKEGRRKRSQLLVIKSCILKDGGNLIISVTTISTIIIFNISQTRVSGPTLIVAPTPYNGLNSRFDYEDENTVQEDGTQQMYPLYNQMCYQDPSPHKHHSSNPERPYIHPREHYV